MAVGGLADAFRDLTTALQSSMSSRQLCYEDVEKSFQTFHGNESLDKPFHKSSGPF